MDQILLGCGKIRYGKKIQKVSINLIRSSKRNDILPHLNCYQYSTFFLKLGLYVCENNFFNDGICTYDSLKDFNDLNLDNIFPSENLFRDLPRTKTERKFLCVIRIT